MQGWNVFFSGERVGSVSSLKIQNPDVQIRAQSELEIDQIVSLSLTFHILRYEKGGHTSSFTSRYNSIHPSVTMSDACEQAGGSTSNNEGRHLL